MDDRLKNLKENMDQRISPATFFTEEDKRGIRRMMREGQPSKQRRGIKLVPAFLSFVAVGIVVLLLSVNMRDNVIDPPKENQTAEKIQAPPHVFNPKTLREEEMVGMLELQSISPSARYYPASSFIAVFTADLPLTGTFQYVKESEELWFRPDKKSLKLLPLPEDSKRVPIISVSNFIENKEAVLNELKIEPGVDVQGTITVSSYRLFYLQKGEQMDRAEASDINGTPLAAAEPEHTGVQNEITLEYTIIPEEMIPVYEEFYKTGDEKLLKNVGVQGIFLMFWQAYEFNHTVMMYELFHQEDPDLPKDYQSFVEHAFEKEQKNLQQVHENIKSQISTISPQIAGDQAIIELGESKKFTLRVNKAGVWKINYFF